MSRNGGNVSRHDRPRRVRLPGFLVQDQIGLGDAVKNLTAAVGLPACGGCERRAEALNRRVVLYGRPPASG